MNRFVLRQLRNVTSAGRMVLLAGRLNLKDLEDALRLTILVDKLRESGSREHRRRMRLAQQIKDLADGIVAREVRDATREANGDPAAMSWQEVADALNIPKTTAYNRYGTKR